MKVVEIFNSIEGEGNRAGFLATFIRLYGCNLKCSYCDTRYGCEGDGFTEMSFEDILNKVKELESKRITLTGGEPLLTSEGWQLATILAVNGFEVNIETNGSIALPTNKHHNIFYTMDWKSPSSGMSDKMIKENIDRLVASTEPRLPNVLKFVVGDSRDLFAMRELIENYKYKGMDYPLHLLGVNIFVSPVFGKIEPQQIVEYMRGFKMEGIKLQLQMHKLIYPVDMRGV